MTPSDIVRRAAQWSEEHQDPKEFVDTASILRDLADRCDRREIDLTGICDDARRKWSSVIKWLKDHKDIDVIRAARHAAGLFRPVITYRNGVLQT